MSLAIDVLAQRPDAIHVASGPAVLSIHLAPLTGERLRCVRDALERAGAGVPAGIVHCSVYRLSPSFPLTVGFDANVPELADTLRRIERIVRAFAVVTEFGEARARVMRTMARAVWTLVRPRAELGQFSEFGDAIPWLLPRARAVGAPEEPARWVQLYRAADELLGGATWPSAATGSD